MCRLRHRPVNWTSNSCRNNFILNNANLFLVKKNNIEKNIVYFFILTPTIFHDYHGWVMYVKCVWNLYTTFTGTYKRLGVLFSKQKLKTRQNWLMKSGLRIWIGLLVWAFAKESAKECWFFFLVFFSFFRNSEEKKSPMLELKKKKHCQFFVSNHCNFGMV